MFFFFGLPNAWWLRPLITTKEKQVKSAIDRTSPSNLPTLVVVVSWTAGYCESSGRLICFIYRLAHDHIGLPPSSCWKQSHPQYRHLWPPSTHTFCSALALLLHFFTTPYYRDYFGCVGHGISNRGSLQTIAGPKENLSRSLRLLVIKTQIPEIWLVYCCIFLRCRQVCPAPACGHMSERTNFLCRDDHYDSTNIHNSPKFTDSLSMWPCPSKRFLFGS